ncbi:MAG: hypothetical protein HYU66_28810 [Armatimonadetes bacterium]|nr:hypothetical protein [Armatimonadota bacterium]
MPHLPHFLLLTLLAAPPEPAETVLLRYQFIPGAQWLHQTETVTSGEVVLRSADGQERRLPVDLQLGAAVLYRVTKLDPATGQATLEVRLRRLRLTRPGENGELALALDLQALDDGIRLQRGEQAWTLPASLEAALPPGAGEGFGTVDPRLLLAPYLLVVTPDGSVKRREQRTWCERLAETDLLGVAAALAQPFGPALAELPARPVAVGQAWRQPREEPAPGGAGTYPIELRYQLAAVEDSVAPPSLRVEYDAAADLGDRPFTLRLGPDQNQAMTLERLHQEIVGRYRFQPRTGRLAEQVQTARLVTTSRGQTAEGAFTIESSLTVQSSLTRADAGGE